jgi:hypothetical protein
LVAEVGDVLDVQEIVNAWLIAINENGVTLDSCGIGCQREHL